MLKQTLISFFQSRRLMMWSTILRDILVHIENEGFLPVKALIWLYTVNYHWYSELEITLLEHEHSEPFLCFSSNATLVQFSKLMIYPTANKIYYVSVFWEFNVLRTAPHVFWGLFSLCLKYIRPHFDNMYPHFTTNTKPRFNCSYGHICMCF